MNAELDIENEQISLLKTVNELHQRNKLTKVNAWKYDYIDSFQSLVQNHHRYVSNFQNVCPSMDTMVKIFELRVDSVSTEIFRIADRVPSFPDDAIDELIETDQSHNDVHEEISMQRNKRDRRRKRRLNCNFRSTIATKAQLNAPLQMLSSIPNPIISKIHRIGGEEGKPTRMLTNMFPTAGKSNLSICGNLRFFDRSRAERVEFDENNDYVVPADNFFELSIKVHSEFMLIRPTGSGYVLKENLDDNENEYCESVATSYADQSDNFIFDFDGMEQCAFFYDATPDINSPLESNNNNPIERNLENRDDAARNGENYENIENDENEEPPNDIEVLHPSLEALSKGEYSYFNGVENLPVGPSFWRSQNTRKRSNPNNNESTPQTAKSRRKKVHKMPSFTTSDDSSDEEFTGTQKIREVNYARWTSQNNLLPTYGSNAIEPIPKDFFEFYQFAPNLRTTELKDTVQENGSLDYINEPLNASEDESPHLNNFDGVQQFTSSPDTSRFNEMPAFNIDIDEQTNVEAPDLEVRADISQLYSGAPPEVEQINIKFSKLPKQINMKKINMATLVSIKKQFERSIDSSGIVGGNEEFEKGYATFANTHRSLAKRFKDIVSPSISLLSLLHNTNDHRFKLDRKPNENTNNFKIQQLKEH